MQAHSVAAVQQRLARDFKHSGGAAAKMPLANGKARHGSLYVTALKPPGRIESFVWHLLDYNRATTVETGNKIRPHQFAGRVETT